MKTYWLTYILSHLVNYLLESVHPDEIRLVLDKWIDVIEDSVSRSSNKYDDTLLPILSLLRVVINVPDDIISKTDKDNSLLNE